MSESWRIITPMHQPYSNKGRAIHNFLKSSNSQEFQKLWKADLIRFAIESESQHCSTCNCRSGPSLPRWTFYHDSILQLKVVRLNQTWPTQGQLVDVIKVGEGVNFSNLPEHWWGSVASEETSLYLPGTRVKVGVGICWKPVGLQKTVPQESGETPIHTASQKSRDSSQNRSVKWTESPARRQDYLKEQRKRRRQYKSPEISN